MSSMATRLGLLSLAILVASPPAAAAGGSELGGADQAFYPASKVEGSKSVAEDLSLIAAAEGWSVGQAETHYRSAVAVGSMGQRLASERPDVFVGTALPDAPDGVPVVYVKGQADSFVDQLARHIDVPIRVIDGQPYALTQLEERMAATQAGLESAGYAVVATSFDITKNGKIEVVVRNDPRIADPYLQMLETLPAELRHDITIEITTGPPGLTQNGSFGGMWVTLENWTNACTSGWSVAKTSTGTTGVTTAAHCDGIEGIRHPGFGVHAFPFQSQHRGQWGDVEWHTSPEPEPPRFYADQTGAIRNVTAVEPNGGISQNESICFFGRKSLNRRCARVARVSASCTFQDNVTVGRLVWMDANISDFGDSGGGWSVDTRAYGSHVGICYDVNLSRNVSVFTPAYYFPAAIGATVRTL